MKPALLQLLPHISSHARGLVYYASQAVEQLNIKPKYWKDLLTDEPFTRKDIIHIQDPQNLQVRLRLCTHANMRHAANLRTPSPVFSDIISDNTGTPRLLGRQPGLCADLDLTRPS